MPLPPLEPPSSLAEIRGFVIPPAGWNLADNRYQDLGIEGPAYRKARKRDDQTDPAERSSFPPSISLPSEPLDFGLEAEWRGP